MSASPHRAGSEASDERKSAQPIEAFTPIYRKARVAGLRLKAHVGEWGTADDVWRAMELLELDEVQHGIAASPSPQLMRALASAGVRLNVCPTSNVKLGRMKSLREHPVRLLFEAGVKVTINTDDPLIFGCTLSSEFLSLYEAGVMTAQELDVIRKPRLIKVFNPGSIFKTIPCPKAHRRC